jgi:hypothetical protein
VIPEVEQRVRAGQIKNSKEARDAVIILAATRNPNIAGAYQQFLESAR